MKRTPINRISARQRAELDRRRRLRQQLLTQCGGLCMECSKTPDWPGLSLSHDVPLARGGKTTLENCRLLCPRCHGKRHGIRIVEP